MFCLYPALLVSLQARVSVSFDLSPIIYFYHQLRLDMFRNIRFMPSNEPKLDEWPPEDSWATSIDRSVHSWQSRLCSLLRVLPASWTDSLREICLYAGRRRLFVLLHSLNLNLSSIYDTELNSVNPTIFK